MNYLNLFVDLAGIADRTVKAEDVPGLIESLGRSVDLTAPGAFVDEAMKRFATNRDGSDEWLAPRLHYAFRLHRREAADPRLFWYLALAWRPDYVRWRFVQPNGSVTDDRYLGPAYKNAFARLWWAAELIRNGRDYSPVSKSFEMQDIQNSWMRMRAFRSRHLAVAAVDVLASFDGKNATSNQVALLSKAVNQTLTTTVLDAIVGGGTHDQIAMDEWVGGIRPKIDELAHMSTLPPGPDEDTIDPSELAPVRELLVDIASRTRGLETVKVGALRRPVLRLSPGRPPLQRRVGESLPIEQLRPLRRRRGRTPTSGRRSCHTATPRVPAPSIAPSIHAVGCSRPAGSTPDRQPALDRWTEPMDVADLWNHLRELGEESPPPDEFPRLGDDEEALLVDLREIRDRPRLDEPLEEPIPIWPSDDDSDDLPDGATSRRHRAGKASDHSCSQGALGVGISCVRLVQADHIQRASLRDLHSPGVHAQAGGRHVAVRRSGPEPACRLGYIDLYEARRVQQAVPARAVPPQGRVSRHPPRRCRSATGLRAVLAARIRAVPRDG